MRPQLRRRLIERLPESKLYALVLLRHGEMGWQLRLRRLGRRPRVVAEPAADGVSLRYGPKRGGARAKIVNEFDSHEARRQTTLLVSQALEHHGVAHAMVPGRLATPQSIAVSADDRPAALAALVSSLTGPEWTIEPIDASGTSRVTRWARLRLGEGTARAMRGCPAVRVSRLLAARSGTTLAGTDLGCRLDFWTRVEDEDVERPDGGTFAKDTRVAPLRNRVVAYLSPATWLAATTASDHWPSQESLPSLFEVREPIDFVYTWVDGADPAWLARKAAFGAAISAAELNASATHVSRFLSRDELRYSLRSVAMYANWVRRIFIVTDGQAPDWLDTNHPKIELVDHKSIFTDPSVLPVFNSHAIESQLHHIEGLSEHYLYLNDDVFFGRPVYPELFFHGNGLAKFFLSRATLDIDPPSRSDLPVMSAAKRNRALIEDEFGATVVNKFKHTPHPQLRSVLEEMEKCHLEDFTRVAGSRFRHPDDLSITSALYHYYAFGVGRAVPATIRYVYQDIAKASTRRLLANLLRSSDWDAFCLNDHESTPELVEAQQVMLADFFRRRFPVASPFERSDQFPDNSLIEVSAAQLVAGMRERNS